MTAIVLLSLQLHAKVKLWNRFYRFYGIIKLFLIKPHPLVSVEVIKDA